MKEEIRLPGFVIFSGYDLDLALESVGKGWAKLIKTVFDLKPENIKIEQVKEKFGGLRIYTDYYDEDFQKVIHIAEEQSFKICEVCGNPGTLVVSGYWYHTACEKHAQRHADVESPTIDEK